MPDWVELSPIIQFYDSLGFHDIAERAIQFFLNRQREDGFIQSFAGYQLETGPLLWTIGKHFDTQDAEMPPAHSDEGAEGLQFSCRVAPP